MDDLDDLLRGVERLAQLEADRPLADAGLEVADDLEVDVGFEQRESDLAEDLVDVLLTKAATASEPLEDAIESVGQGLEHARAEATRGLSRSHSQAEPARATARPVAAVTARS